MLSDEEYNGLKEKEDDLDTSKQQEIKRYEEQVLFNKNAKAIQQAINHQNTVLAEYQQKLSALSAQMAMMSDELNRIKQTQMNELISKMGHGSTSLD